MGNDESAEANYREAKEHIARAKRKEAVRLHLNNRSLAALPPEIGSLASLRELYLADNRLTTLPPEIGSLASLRALYVGNNRLTALPPEIGSLAALHTLYLSNNELATLPSEIGSLTGLEYLYLGNNRLAALPPEIGSLAALSFLDLGGNRLDSLPSELLMLFFLRHLFLHGNGALQLPASVLGPTFDECASSSRQHLAARPADILNFYFSRQAGEAEGTLMAVNELKVMLVGRGGAGKTSLRRFFLGQPHDAAEPETPGIALDDFRLPCHRGHITVHLWDFAGQEITHALHQFFLTEGCVYVVVLDPRSNTEMPDAFYWLDQLKRYAPQSPVLVAVNRQDARQGGYDVDRDLLRERYPQVRAFVPTNCATRSGCVVLRAALTETIEGLDPTEPPMLRVPENWLKVEWECWTIGRPPKAGVVRSMIDKVAGGASAGGARRHALTFEEFKELCKRHGVIGLERQESLARLLHKLGAVLHFVDDPRLRDTSVLNPHWVTDGVYRLLRYKDGPGSDGVLSLAEATEALPDKSEKSARYLLGLMERFEMCFPLDEAAAEPTRWLVPGALNPYQPEGLGQQWQGPGGVRLRYDYGTPVAEGILPRFIVLTHPMRGDAVWRNGVVLCDGEAAVLVRRGEKPNLIEVAAFGPEARRLRLLEVVQGTMDRINAELPGKKPVVEQELAGLPGTYKNVAELEAAELAETQVVVASEPTPALVQPTEQLNLVSERESRDPSRVPFRAFLSYSHADRKFKNEFVTNLAAMQKRKLIQPWHDGMIEPGKEWKKEIETQLESMDLFIGLLTNHFINSDFIEQVELNAARQRLRERDGREFLFVLILVDDVPVDGLDLAHYQLLKPGGKAVSKHKTRKEGFNQAQKEIEELLKSRTPRREDPAGGPGPSPDPTPRGLSGGVTGVTMIIRGDYVAGNKPMTDDHSINIGGSVINSQVAQTLTHSTNMIQQQAPGERKELLDQLRREVEELLKRLPADKADEAPQVAENLEMLVKQATSDRPNRKWYSVSAEGLLEASKWAKDFAGNLFGTIGQIGRTIWPGYAPPRDESKAEAKGE